MDNSNEKSLPNIYKRLFKLFLLNEMNKINESYNNSTKSNLNSNCNSNISYPFSNNEIRISSNISAFEESNLNKELEEKEIFSNEENINSDHICPFWDISKISFGNTQNYNNCYNQQNPFKSISKSSSGQDDIYSLDFQGRYFIEK